jgi:hypothetical protein
MSAETGSVTLEHKIVHYSQHATSDTWLSDVVEEDQASHVSIVHRSGILEVVPDPLQDCLIVQMVIIKAGTINKI